MRVGIYNRTLKKRTDAPELLACDLVVQLTEDSVSFELTPSQICPSICLMLFD
jgi:hypothetical protein